MSNFLDDALTIYADIKAVGKEADHMAVGDTEVFDIPDAEHVNALLVKGKGNKRFRINGFQATREK